MSKQKSRYGPGDKDDAPQLQIHWRNESDDEGTIVHTTDSNSTVGMVIATA